MRRRLLNLLTALSLLMCVAVCVLWVHSQSRPSMVQYDWLHEGDKVEVRSVHVTSAKGVVEMTADRTIADSPEAETSFRAPPEPRGFHFLGVLYAFEPLSEWGGFKYQWLRKSFPGLGLSVAVYGVRTPYWAWILAFAALPLVRLLRWQRRRLHARRQAAGLCPA